MNTRHARAAAGSREPRTARLDADDHAPLRLRGHAAPRRHAGPGAPRHARVDRGAVTEPRRVVIIGGGLAGLAASYDLARAGHRVTVLEGAQDFGGLASSFRLEGRA